MDRLGGDFTRVPVRIRSDRIEILRDIAHRIGSDRPRNRQENGRFIIPCGSRAVAVRADEGRDDFIGTRRWIAYIEVDAKRISRSHGIRIHEIANLHIACPRVQKRPALIHLGKVLQPIGAFVVVIHIV